MYQNSMNKQPVGPMLDKVKCISCEDKMMYDTLASSGSYKCSNGCHYVDELRLNAFIDRVQIYGALNPWIQFEARYLNIIYS